MNGGRPPSLLRSSGQRASGPRRVCTRAWQGWVKKFSSTASPSSAARRATAASTCPPRRAGEPPLQYRARMSRHGMGGQVGLPLMLPHREAGAPTSPSGGRQPAASSPFGGAPAAAATSSPSPFLAAPAQPQPASPAAGGGAAAAGLGGPNGAGGMHLAVPANKPPVRCFTVQMMDVVWRRRGSNGAREPTIASHRSIMSRPASLKDFQDAVYVWAGVQPEKVRTDVNLLCFRTARQRTLIERWLLARS